MERPRFTNLPIELLEAIFLHLDSRSLLALSETNKYIYRLTVEAPLLWRNRCRTSFKIWDPSRQIAAKYAGPLSDVDWRDLYTQRVSIDKQTRRILNNIVDTQHDRISRVNEIAEFGLDAKEALLKELACPDDAEDVLARRYYATAALDRIHREMAINTWKNVLEGKPIPIERALGAYDIFTRGGEIFNLDIMIHDLDRLAEQCSKAKPDMSILSPRKKASTLACWLREQGFRGAPEDTYRALQNSFIGLVLRKSPHESLPLISVAIYCAIAHRLGLDARPCGFLYHVYALIYAPKDHNLDGEYKPTSSEDLDFMYLDPFRSANEVMKGDLQRVLIEMGVPVNEHDTFLSHAGTREIVLRTAKNIMNSVQILRQREAQMRSSHGGGRSVAPDVDNAFYSTIWAMLVLGPADEHPSLATFATATRRRQFLPYLLQHIRTHHPWDVTLVSQFVVPMFYNQTEGHRLLQFVTSLHQKDKMRKPVKRRTERTRNVEYKVGQYFQHKRYSYEAVITGWDVACDAAEDWIRDMGVDRLPRGREQAFYKVLVCDKSVRYVAEENIQLISRDQTPTEAMRWLAGRYFRRWDDENWCFVSNKKAEYPDD